MCGIALSAYKQLTKPTVLPQYHRVEQKAIKGIPFCGVTSNYSLSEKAYQGKQLFKNNCAQCHHRNMRDDLTGPALAGVQNRWAAYPREDLYAWIRNSQALIDAKHPKAMELWDAWQPTNMNAFPNLSDADIEAILAYIEAQ